jgi:hypothetical protein
MKSPQWFMDLVTTILVVGIVGSALWVLFQ